MISRRWTAAVTVGISLLFTLLMGPVMAHHASTPFYDPDRRVEIEGTVTVFKENLFLSFAQCMFASASDWDKAKQLIQNAVQHKA